MEIRAKVTEGWRFLTTTSEPLPDYALHYLDALKARFESAQEPGKAGVTDAAVLDAYEEASRIVAKPPGQLAWTDLMLLDLSIVRILSLNCLVLKVAELRHRAAGHAVPLPPELSPKLESVTEDKAAMLRCEAEMLVTQLWQVRIARNSRERYVGELRRTVLWWLVGIELVLIVMPTFFGMPVPLFFVVLTTGLIGALTSILRRLQTAAEAVAVNLDQSSDLSALAHEKRAIVISLLMGGVFAMVLYVAFIAGLSDLSGNLAPKFSMPAKNPPEGVDFFLFVNLIGPATGQDYAKTIVWSFAAGFFEQFVPDVLDRLVKRERKAQ